MRYEAMVMEPIRPDAAMSSRGIVAQNLLIARNALELTQQEVADASGISRATIAQLEAGTGDPRLSTLELLAATLHMPVHFLLLDQAAFRALAELIADAEAMAHSVEKPRDQLSRALSARRGQSRFQAATLGIDAAREAGLTGDAHRVGAAIGAARFAAEGTFLGAHLAYLLELFKPVVDSPGVQPPRPPEYYQGDGI